MTHRIGFGFDIHRLAEGIPLFIGGVKIEHDKGSVGHSDADVLIHAICDALLGAANLGDIGKHFPDTSEEFKGIDSAILLKRVVDLIRENDFNIYNIDCTVCLQQPKLVPYITLMKKKLSQILDISINEISIKAKTSEGIGFVGREEGISAYAVVLLISR